MSTWPPVPPRTTSRCSCSGSGTTSPTCSRPPTSSSSSALWEGQPVGLQEALHAGAPIVATDAGGTAAVLGGAGIIVANHDPQALADAVADVLGSPDLTVDLRERARARAAELPTRADAVADAVAAYRRVRKGPGASET